VFSDTVPVISIKDLKEIENNPSNVSERREKVEKLIILLMQTVGILMTFYKNMITTTQLSLIVLFIF